MGPKAASSTDMRRVAYGPNRYAWDSAVIQRILEYRGGVSIIDNYRTEGRLARMGQVTSKNRNSPAEIIMFGEHMPFSVPWIIGQANPMDRDYESGSYTDGRAGLKWFMEPRHGKPRDGLVGRGFNFVYFDGHVAYDRDYFENYAADLASLMWGYFLY